LFKIYTLGESSLKEKNFLSMANYGKKSHSILKIYLEKKKVID
jgi:hypothetical protein